MVKPTESEKPKESPDSRCQSTIKRQAKPRGKSGGRERSDERKRFLTTHDVVCEYILSLLVDCFDSNPLYGRADFERDCSTVSARFHHEGLSFATQTLPAFFDSLLCYLETGISAYPGFKIKRGCTYPVFLQQLVAPIYDDPSSAHTAMNIDQLYQVCVAFKKLRGPYKQSVLDKQLVEFVETDIDIKYIEFDAEPNRDILRRARQIIGRVVKGLNPFDPDTADSFLPRPGPGATNTPIENHLRFQPHVEYTTISEVFDYDEWFYPPSYPPRGRRPWDLRVGSTSHKSLKKDFEPTSRLKFVDKTYSKARGICIEQLETQYLQQGIKNALYDRIESHPETSGRVNFTDQSINGDLACAGSGTGHTATIDMSAASDRISRKLVAYLFADNEELLQALLALSTNTIELPDTINFIVDFPSAKYAPMGSALCFPIMSLVHYALIKAIIELSVLPRSKDYPVYVYGDDIIVPTECVQPIYDWLPRFGMKLNEEKSFHRSRFRESCGTHAYNGMDITPSRFKSVINNTSPMSDLISALRIEGDLFRKGFRKTARLIRTSIHKVRRFGASNFPFVSPKSQVLGWIRDDSDAPHRRVSQVRSRRWNDDLQFHEYKVPVIVPYVLPLPLLKEDAGYLRKLVTRVKRDAKKVSGSCEDLRIRHKWLPESTF